MNIGTVMMCINPVSLLTWPARLVAICLAVAIGIGAEPARAADRTQTAFASSGEAVSALVAAVRTEGTDALVAVLGPQGAALADSGDAVADAARRNKFVAAFDDAHELKQEDASKAILIIGKDQYPFPVPLVEKEGKWRWDTAAGLDEILTRRIGENELAAIEVLRACVDAQREYAAVDRDGLGPQYARRLLSREGTKDGLYWPASAESEASPLGPLVAQARSEGYRRPKSSDGPSAYHGYFYRVLYAQGSNAAGGARDYIINDRMIGGFALIASPAEYDNSGVMTFIVNEDGDVFQKDLGPDTGGLASQIKRFDPDQSWTKVATP